MPLQQYSVSYRVDALTWVNLTNVQSINLSIGRQAQLDQIRASTASFEMRYPTGYANPIAALVSGTIVRIQNITGTPYTIWFGRISDVQARYGIPYTAGVGNADYVDVTCEGFFAAAGRVQGGGYSMASNTISQQVVAASLASGIGFVYRQNGSDPVLAATTVNSTWGDWFNRVCQSTNSRLWDSHALDVPTAVSPFYNFVNTVNFSDTANNATNQVYNQINFGSLADNYYTQVTVTPETAGAATVTQAGASQPYRTYQTNTLNNTTAQATDYANYLLSNYGTSRFAIQSITCSADAQNSFQLDKIGDTTVGINFSCSPGTQIAVTFRGTTVQCLIEGVTMSATPAGTSFTYYLSGADLNAYLILDNATFGKLDSNKLGY